MKGGNIWRKEMEERIVTLIISKELLKHLRKKTTGRISFFLVFLGENKSNDEVTHLCPLESLASLSNITSEFHYVKPF